MRNGIALLMTLFFIIAITLVVSASLQSLKKGQALLLNERLLAQSAYTVEDVLRLLEHFSPLMQVHDTTTLASFFQTAPKIAFDEEGLTVSVEFASARRVPNINTLSVSTPLRAALRRYFERSGVLEPDFLEALLLDSMEGKQTQYRTGLFDRYPWMYREGIVDSEHLEKILDFYVLRYRDDSVYRIPWKQLVRFGDRGETGVDVNYLTPEAWTLILPDRLPEEVDTIRSEALSCTSDNKLEIPAAPGIVAAIGLQCYLPILEVTIRLSDTEDHTARISFEYDPVSKKAQRFDYVI